VFRLGRVGCTGEVVVTAGEWPVTRVARNLARCLAGSHDRTALRIWPGDWILWNLHGCGENSTGPVHLDS